MWRAINDLIPNVAAFDPLNAARPVDALVLSLGKTLLITSIRTAPWQRASPS
jgi:hypothetical protein